MALVWGVVAAALGLAASGLLHKNPPARETVARWVRRLAAALASLYALIFAAGAIGALAQGDNNPKLVALVLGAAVAAWLLWRGPHRHLALGGYWLAGGWLLYSAVIIGHGPVALLFQAVALPGLFTAGLRTVAAQGDADRGAQ